MKWWKWGTVALGVALCLAPFVFGYSGNPAGLAMSLATGGVIANDVYGWYTEDTDGKVGPCARFDPGPIRIDAAGKAVSVHIFFEDGGLAP